MHSYSRHIITGAIIGATSAIGFMIAHAATTGETGIPLEGLYRNIFTKMLVDPTPATTGTVKNTQSLGGIPAANYQKLVTGTCPVGQWAFGVKADNSIDCR